MASGRDGPPAEGSEWFTIGVLVKKSDPKTAKSGKGFIIWELSDLVDPSVTLNVMLFDGAGGA